VAVQGLRAADRDRGRSLAERRRDRARFREIADRGRGRVGVDVLDLVGVRGAVRQCDRRRTGRLATVGPRLDHVMGIGGRAVPQQLGIGRGPAASGGFRFFEDQERGTLAQDEAVAPRVERPGGQARIVIPSRRERADDVERAERKRRQRDLAAARDRRIDPAFAQVA